MHTYRRQTCELESEHNVLGGVADVCRYFRLPFGCSRGQGWKLELEMEMEDGKSETIPDAA